MVALEGNKDSGNNCSNEKARWIIGILSLCVTVAQIAEVKENEFLRVGCVIVILIYILLQSKMYVVPISLFLIYNTKLLSLFGISCATLITIFIVLREVLLGRKKIETRFFLYLICSLIIGSGYLAFGRSNDCIVLIKYFLSLMFILFCFQDSHCNRWYSLCKEFLMAGFAVAVCSSLIFNRAAVTATRYAITDDTGSNTTAFFCGLVFAFSAVILFERNVESVLKRWGIITLGLSVITGIMTGSRTFFLMVVISCVCLLITVVKNSKCLFRNIIIIMSGIAIGILFISFNEKMNQEFLYLMRRIQSPRGNDISGGRLDIWETYFDMIIANPVHLLWGYVPEDFGINNMAHNAVIEQFVQFGIIGNIPIIAFGIFVYRRLKSSVHNMNAMKSYKYEKELSVISLILIFVSGMVSHSFMALPKTLFIYYFIYMYLCYKQGKEKRYRNISLN